MKKEILHRAVDLLSRREHSHKELHQKLIKKDFDSVDIYPVLDYLIEKDYLSDERFAESIFRVRVDRGFGWLSIKNELSQKGVCSTIINELNKNDEIDWYLQAELAYNKRFNTPLDEYFNFKESQSHSSKDKAYQLAVKEKAKRMRFLQYRGFSPDQIITVLNLD